MIEMNNQAAKTLAGPQPLTQKLSEKRKSIRNNQFGVMKWKEQLHKILKLIDDSDIEMKELGSSNQTSPEP
ncbi:7628_t:CDS:2, partial [Acaulospora colombiana]